MKKNYRLRESTVEGDVVNHGEATDWVQYKLKSANNRGLPDRMFLKGGVILFIEFKSPGEPPTKLQKLIHGALCFAGFPVHVIDNIAQGKNLLNIPVDKTTHF